MIKTLTISELGSLSTSNVENRYNIVANYDDPIFDLFGYNSSEVIKYYIDLGLDIFYKRSLVSDSLFDVLIERKIVDLVFDTLSVLPDSKLEKHSYVKLPINVLIKACDKRHKTDHVAKNA